MSILQRRIASAPFRRNSFCAEISVIILQFTEGCAVLQYLQLGELLLVEIGALAVAGCFNWLGFWSLVLVLAFGVINSIRSLALSSVFKDFIILPKSQVSLSNCLVIINLSSSGIFLIRIEISYTPYADEEISRASRALRFASSL